MKASLERAWWARRFSCHFPFLAWTTTSEWALIPWRWHSSLMEMSVVMYSRSSFA